SSRSFSRCSSRFSAAASMTPARNRGRCPGVRSAASVRPPRASSAAAALLVLACAWMCAICPASAFAAADIRVAIAEGVASVDVGGGPMVVADLKGHPLTDQAPTWLRLKSSGGGVDAQGRRASGVRLTAVDGGTLRVGARDYPGALEI